MQSSEGPLDATRIEWSCNQAGICVEDVHDGSQRDSAIDAFATASVRAVALPARLR